MSLFHPDYSPSRLIKHLPHGIFMGTLVGTVILAPAAYLFWQIFRTYEEDECLHTGDQMWKDLLGVVCGFPIGILIACVAWAIVLTRIL